MVTTYTDNSILTTLIVASGCFSAGYHDLVTQALLSQKNEEVYNSDGGVSMRIRRSLLFLVLILMLLLPGCINLKQSASTLTVYLTDAVIPITDFEHLYLTVESIVLIPSEECVDCPEIVLDGPGEPIDLIDLIGEVYEFGKVEAEGKYGQLRFIVSEASATIGGEPYSVMIPAKDEDTGLAKLMYNLFGLEITGDTELVIDFDLAHSLTLVKLPPQAPIDIIMVPVINIRQGILFDIGGIVTPGAEPKLVGLFDSEDELVTTTFSLPATSVVDGTVFRFVKIEPGDYEIRVYVDFSAPGFSVETAIPDGSINVKVTVEDILDLEIQLGEE